MEELESREEEHGKPSFSGMERGFLASDVTSDWKDDNEKSLAQ